jgi:hypothetical protein
MWRNITIGICFALAVAGAVSGQSQRSPATLDDLLTELRGLRADLNSSVSATTRVQLVVGRLQVQEQRIASVSQELTETQNQLRTAIQQRERTNALVLALEQRIVSRTVVPDRIMSFEQELEDTNIRLVRERNREADLRSRETELLAMLTAEQSRWIELNAGLDALERAFTR